MSTLRLAFIAVAAVLALAACPAKSSTPDPNPTPTPSPTPAPGRGAACANGACAEGLSCVTFTGIAGQPLDSCEVACGAAGECAAGEACRDVADGPKHVCVAAADNTQPQQGEKCPAGTCAAGLTCVEYYGIAGPGGPKFTSCEIPCKGKTACPGSQKCITIADGPGEVCRP